MTGHHAPSFGLEGGAMLVCVRCPSCRKEAKVSPTQVLVRCERCSLEYPRLTGQAEKWRSVSAVHVPAEPDGLRQLCARCGIVLIDHTNAVVEPGSGPPGFFAAGVAVEKGDGFSVVVPGDEPSCAPSEP